MAFFRTKKDDEKETNAFDDSDLNKIGTTDVLQLMLKRLVFEGDYNKAENILFEELEKNRSLQMHDIAINFYNLLLEKSDDELASNNFSREEIYQGIDEINTMNFS